MTDVVLECKICGGMLKLENSYSARCQSCGTVSIINQDIRGETKLLLNSANRDRIRCDFERAISSYEELLQIDEKNAEAHFGLFISHYGIEFVKDEDGRYVPTCHRVSTESVYENEHYLNAIKYASDALKVEYKKYATEIENIRKGVLVRSNLNDTYDIFICYKQSHKLESGEIVPTVDSKLASDIYVRLRENGYKVFLAEHSLAGRVGEEYEPIIFNALSSCKMMILLASDKDFIESVWLRNEWGRYIRMIRDGKKLSNSLVTVFMNGLSPYELPNQLQQLQGLDSTSFDFASSLLNHVSKIMNANLNKAVLNKKELKEISIKKPTKIENHVVIQKVKWKHAGKIHITPNEETAIKKGFDFLALEDFKTAEKIFSETLEQNPNNYDAKFGKLMIKVGAKNHDEFVLKAADNLKCEKQNDKYIVPDYEEILQSITNEELAQNYLNLLFEIISTLLKRKEAYTKQLAFRICALFETYYAYSDDTERINFLADKIINLIIDASLRDNNNPKDFTIAEAANIYLSSYLKILNENDVDKYISTILMYVSLYDKKLDYPVIGQRINEVLQIDPSSIKAAWMLELFKNHLNQNNLVLLFTNKNINQIKTIIDNVLKVNPNNETYVNYFLQSIDILLTGNKKSTINKGIEAFDHLLGYIDKDNKEHFCNILVKFSNILMAIGLFKQSYKYIMEILSINPALTQAHMLKLKYSLKARDILDLINHKKLLTTYPDFNNAINSASPEEYEYIMDIYRKQKAKNGEIVFMQDTELYKQFIYFPCSYSLYKIYARRKLNTNAKIRKYYSEYVSAFGRDDFIAKNNKQNTIWLNIKKSILWVLQNILFVVWVLLIPLYFTVILAGIPIVISHIRHAIIDYIISINNKIRKIKNNNRTTK